MPLSPSSATACAVIAASAPARVRDTLAAQPDGAVAVVHRGSQAVYVEVQGHCLGVVAATATAVPCALQVAGDVVPRAARAEIRGGVLHLDDVALRIGRIRDVRVPRLPGVPADGPAPLSHAEVAALVGVGDGLTPYGDDVLCGWLGAHRAAGIATPDVDHAVRALAHRTTLLSATLLDCAVRGEVLAEFAAWLRSLGTAREPAAAATLASIGHTSGLGLLRGARRALTALGIRAEVAA
ncbi:MULTISPECIES: DUF2877 domain-containing protein [unclassified Nocardioides]|uniref:DUF2877 domain-containing protein n=1 Tax=unclassified Nocardioides TaxID=2615069 RepID=UPI001294CFAD|nr:MULTISPECIES: DUF2877 domain-containing protein [unclassified Nocardioides]